VARGGPSSRRRVCFPLGAVCLALVSCATTDLPPLDTTGSTFQREDDEKRIWETADRLEQEIDKSGRRYKDPRLDAYLTGVAQKLLPPEARAPGLGVRVKVIQNPLLNAFALPNGAIYIHSGMLARMENESQLSAVLGHELTHYTHRHAVKQMRSLQNKATVVGVLQAMLPGFEGLTNPLGALWTLASTSGYSQELETEADEHGLQVMVIAGYDPTQAPAVIELLQRDLDEQKVKEPYFFGTHPKLQARIDNYRRLLDTRYAIEGRSAAAKSEQEDFLSHTDQLLLDNALLDIGLGRLKTARTAIEKHLKRRPQSSQAHFLMGEVHRRSGTEESYTGRAAAEYLEASRLDPDYPQPHRELGLLYRAQGSSEQARAELGRYLALTPAAADAPIIRGYIKNLEDRGGKK
jgi:beta-barrel assembly-enhancing protease